jgi:DNA-binding LacI/PurR family transcriptional regulator
MHVRMKEVALRAGVSTQTVSRVLRNSKLVAPETAARVWEVTRELGLSR